MDFEYLSETLFSEESQEDQILIKKISFKKRLEIIKKEEFFENFPINIWEFLQENLKFEKNLLCAGKNNNLL